MTDRAVHIPQRSVCGLLYMRTFHHACRALQRFDVAGHDVMTDAAAQPGTGGALHISGAAELREASPARPRCAGQLIAVQRVDRHGAPNPPSARRRPSPYRRSQAAMPTHAARAREGESVPPAHRYRRQSPRSAAAGQVLEMAAIQHQLEVSFSRRPSNSAALCVRNQGCFAAGYGAGSAGRLLHLPGSARWRTTRR